jgi:Fe-S-cluster containining protein
MCCNGVLFADVELQPGDNARQLKKLGLPIFTKGRKEKFSQPCACLDGVLCRVYEDRPVRCKTFECRLLQRAQCGETTLTAALKSVKSAILAASSVQKLARELGNTDETIPLSRRYAAIMAEPIDLAASDEIIERRSELMLAVGKLTRIIEKDFLT